MWHRYEPALRTAVSRALVSAAAAGRVRAEAEDLARGIVSEGSSQAAKLLQNRGLISDTPTSAEPVAEFAPSAIAALDFAYREAADAGVKQVTCEHVLVGLLHERLINSSLTVDQARAICPQAGVADATMDEETRRSKIYDELSAIHPDFSGDPYPLYQRLRQWPKVRRDPLLPVWVITGYDDVLAVLRDPRFTVQRKQSRTTGNSFSIDVLPDGPVRRQLGVLAGVLAKKMIFLDPPEHTRVRNLMNQNFTPRACEVMRPRIQQIADELVDRAIAEGKIDLILDFALQLPIIVICEMIGFPPADRAQLKKWADAVGNTLALGCTMRQELDARRAMIDMRAYFDRIMEGVRRDPSANNLLSMLVRAGYPSNEEEQAELFSNCVFLLGAGHETTTSLIGNGMRILKNHPDQLEKLQENPSLVAGAVEELLRFESPVQWTSRQATADVQLGEVTIKAGDSVLISLGAANRDPKQFPDPDRLDITRKDAHRHLAFSGGIHFCLGAGLSRVEAQVGLTTLLRRLPGLTIPEQKLRWKSGSTIRTLESLPAAF
jgi:cytochrome P450